MPYKLAELFSNPLMATLSLVAIGMFWFLLAGILSFLWPASFKKSVSSTNLPQTGGHTPPEPTPSPEISSQPNMGIEAPEIKRFHQTIDEMKKTLAAIHGNLKTPAKPTESEKFERDLPQSYPVNRDRFLTTQSRPTGPERVPEAQAVLETVSPPPTSEINVIDIDPEQQVIAHLAAMIQRLEAENRTGRTALANIQGRQEADRIAREKKLIRFRNRAELWRKSWDKILALTHKEKEGNLLSMKDTVKSHQNLLDEQGKRLENTLLELRSQRKQAEDQRAQQLADAALARKREREDLQRQLEELEQQKIVTEKQIREIEDIRSSAIAQFQATFRTERLQVREEQGRWRNRLAILQRDLEDKINVCRKEAEQLKAAAEAQRGKLEQEISAQQNLLASRLTELRAEEESLARQQESEKSLLVQKISEVSAELADWTKKRDEAKISLERLMDEHAHLRNKTHNWAAGRYQTLQRLSGETQRNAENLLQNMERDKASLQHQLHLESDRLRTLSENIVRQASLKDAEIAKSRRKKEEEHKAFLNDAREREEGMREELASLQKTLDELEKKRAATEQKNSRQIYRQRERYERLLLSLQQKLDQQNVAQESNLSAQRHSLEALKRRIENRRNRVERILQQRRESIETVFRQAQTTLELALQECAREKGRWIENLLALQNEKERRLQDRERLLAAPAQVSQDIREKLHHERQIFEKEKGDLLRAAEKARVSFQEQVAANRQALEGAHQDLQAAGNDLVKEEKAAQEFLTVARRIITQFESLQTYLRPRADEATGPLSASSVA